MKKILTICLSLMVFCSTASEEAIEGMRFEVSKHVNLRRTAEFRKTKRNNFLRVVEPGTSGTILRTQALRNGDWGVELQFDDGRPSGWVYYNPAESLPSLRLFSSDRSPLPADAIARAVAAQTTREVAITGHPTEGEENAAVTAAGITDGVNVGSIALRCQEPAREPAAEEPAPPQPVLTATDRSQRSMGYAARRMMSAVHQKCFQPQENAGRLAIVPSPRANDSCQIEVPRTIKELNCHSSPQQQRLIEEERRTRPSYYLPGDIAPSRHPFHPMRDYQRAECRTAIGYSMNSEDGHRRFVVGPCGPGDGCLDSPRISVAPNEVWLGNDNKSDCSSFVGSIIASSGRKFLPNRPVSDSNGNSDTLGLTRTFLQQNSCFQAVRLEPGTPPLAPGDLIFTGVNPRSGAKESAHVVVVGEVFNPQDPLGLSGRTNCDVTSVGSAFTTIDSLSDGGPEEQVKGPGQFPFWKEACEAAVYGRGNGAPLAGREDKPDIHVFRYNDSKPGCEPSGDLVPRGHQCIDQCPGLQDML